jgi:hypothetical protein
MKRKPNEIDILALQVKQGNLLAKEKLRNLLVPGIALIVRRTLETGNVRTALARQIFHEFRRVAAQVWFPDTKVPSSVIELVARRLSDDLVEGLNRRPIGADMSRETVVA